jgi:GDPmannose 4,6-dehydratase
MKKKALILGISGQDGSFLSELLIEKKYEVHGVVRRHSVAENQSSRISSLEKIILHYGDIQDSLSLLNIIKKTQPETIYNLAAMSHVRISFDIPSYTIQTNGIGVLNILEILRYEFPKIKYYQASSSEMFGNSIDEDGFQRLSTPMNPASPYGCSKLLAYNLVRHYRIAYNLHLCNGILFNHESFKRGSNFVTSKIIKTAIEIKKGLKKELILGNLDSYRDWGHSKDYVRAIYQITNYEKPLDWIVSTGETRSIRELCKLVFDRLGMNYLDYVKQDKKYMRAEELKYLKGDNSKIKEILKWKPEILFEEMIDETINYWKNII